MSQVNHKPHSTHTHPGKGHTGHGPNRPAANITNFNQQAMDQQMAIFQLKQAQLMQQLTAQIIGLQAPQLSPQQVAQQAQQQQAAQLRQQQFEAWNAQQMASFEQKNIAIQQTFQISQQSLGGLESSLGGFLNQSFAPLQLGSALGGQSSLVPANSPLLGGPIVVSFYPTGRGFR